MTKTLLIINCFPSAYNSGPSVHFTDVLGAVAVMLAFIWLLTFLLRRRYRIQSDLENHFESYVYDYKNVLGLENPVPSKPYVPENNLYLASRWKRIGILVLIGLYIVFHSNSLLGPMDYWMNWY